MEIRVFPFLIVTERDSPLVGPGPEFRSWCAPIVGAPVQANLVTGNRWKNKYPNRFIQCIQQSECKLKQKILVVWRLTTHIIIMVVKCCYGRFLSKCIGIIIAMRR